MLKKETIKTINDLLEDELNKTEAIKIFIEHQLTLPEKHQMPEIKGNADNMGEELKTLKVAIRRMTVAQNDFHDNTSMA